MREEMRSQQVRCGGVLLLLLLSLLLLLPIASIMSRGCTRGEEGMRGLARSTPARPSHNCRAVTQPSRVTQQCIISRPSRVTQQCIISRPSRVTQQYIITQLQRVT